MPIVTARSIHWFCVLVVLVLAASARPIGAQCAAEWAPGESTQGVNNDAIAMVPWDPDGAGPMSPRLVVAGAINIAGGRLVGGVATWDPATRGWEPLGSLFSSVAALAVRPNGELVAAGQVNTTQWVVASWNGTTWVTLLATTTLNTTITALAALPNGELVVGGAFASLAGVTANNIARWDGTSWSAMGSGTDRSVRTLAVAPNGDVVVGGYFTSAGGVAASSIARWNGSWSAMGSLPFPPVTYPSVDALAVRSNGNVIAGSNGLAEWDGATWTVLGSSFSSALQLLPNGDLVVGGTFTAMNGVSAQNIARRSGASWSALGAGVGGPQSSGPNQVFSLAVLPSGELFAGGKFTTAGGAIATNVASWNGAAWAPLGFGFDGAIEALVVAPGGDLIVGGAFQAIGGTPMNHIARWNGAAWSSLGPGVDGNVNHLAWLPNGDVVAAATIGGSLGAMLRWNGSVWSTMPDSGLFAIRSLLTMPNGDLLATGQGLLTNENVRIWDGTSWASVGAGFNASVLAATVWNGDLVVGGSFTSASGVSANGLARWNGSTWSALGSGINFVPYPNAHFVRALTTSSNGNLVAGGRFTLAGGVPVNHIAQWDGTAWSSLGTGVTTSRAVLALATLPGGDLVAAGDALTAAGGITVNNIARWNGTVWSPIGAGIEGPASFTYVNALATTTTGDLLAGGAFAAAGGRSSAHLARLTTTCPATVTTFGVGCAESNGPDVLTANNLPWMDATFRATATGLPTVAIVLTLTSVTPIPQGVAPLTLAFPQAGIGCDVLTMLDLLGLIITTNGTAESQFFLPSSSPLVGLPFYHQLVSIEVDPQGAWTSVTATNALQLVAGSF